MIRIKVLKQATFVEGSARAAWWTLVSKFNGKDVEAFKKAAEKNPPTDEKAAG